MPTFLHSSSRCRAAKFFRAGGLTALVALTVLFGACAPKAPLLTPGAERYPEFLFPQIPPDLAGTAAAASRGHQEGWQYLQVGNFRAAERSLSTVLRRTPGFYPAHAALGYVEFAQRDYKQAVQQFDRALQANPVYVPALVGRGEALLALKQETAALESFEAAVRVDGTLADVRRRVEVLRFRSLQQALATAQQAAQQGRLDEARGAYHQAIAASPESGFLHRELAVVERRAGDLGNALAHARRATELDAGDGAAHLMIAEMLEERGEAEAALAAYEQAQALGAGTDIEARMEAIRERLAFARLPEEYRAIGSAPRVSRGDLAALVGMRLEPLLKLSRRRDVPLITDTRGHWAQHWISTVTRSGVMDVFGNHTFQPNAPVRRSDLAQVSNRVLTIIASRDRAAGSQWQGARHRFSDLGPGHLAYSAASASVAAGVITLEDGATFRPSQIVTGEEAVRAIARLEALGARAAGRTAR
jgi:tetratricopeptide (TPR) repeat protein